jgi:tetratricopeptide (TPR) repeat protein
MQKLEIVISRHIKQFQRTRKVYEGLPHPELHYDSSLYLNQNQYFEAIEVELRHSGLSALNVEEELYQLRYSYNISEDFFYVRGINPDSPGQADLDDITELEHVIWDATEFMMVHKYIEASKLLDMALVLDDKSILTYANLGVIAHKQRNRELAMFYFNKALSVEPNHVHVLSYKLDVLRGGDLTAFAAFKQVIDKLLELNPYHPVALDYKCQVAFQTRDFEAMKKYAPRYFEHWYMHDMAVPHVNNLLLLMPVDESMLFLQDFLMKLKWNGARTKLQRIKNRYLKKVEESGDSFKERGAAPIIDRVSPVNTVSKHINSFTFEGKI